MQLTKVSTVSYAVLRETAEHQLREELETGAASNCRDFSLQAFNLLKEVAFSVQYVHDPNSKTGVFLRVIFWPVYELKPISIEVPAPWIAWQISPK